MIIDSQFIPAKGLASAHLQTLLPTFMRSKLDINYSQQTLELDDGDFIDLAWSSTAEDNKPIVVIFHGLEGSIHSPYAKGLMLAIEKQGWTALLMHFRGCSGRANRLPRSYHSGETGDATFLLNWLSQRYPYSPLAAVGFSLGGNMLLKLQAELAEKSPLKATVSVCAPLVLSSCAARLEQGFSKIYQYRLLSDLRNKLKIKAEQHNYKELINLDDSKINQLNSFWKFDDLVTAPLHGFSGVEDYYQRSSSRQYLKNISQPTLMLQALDDPFMSADVIPDSSELSDSTLLELSTYGGHVGFISGSILKPEFWLEKRIVEYMQDFL